jgi:formylglycine-generating enzyme required for sulfatase activity
MKTRKSKGVWICLVLLLVIAGVFVVRGTQPRQSPLDDQTQLLRRLAAVNDPALADELDGSVVLVPAGEFLRGSDTGNYNEGPRQLVYLDAFEMDRYEVTNVQYSRFWAATGHEAPPYWKGGNYPYGQADFPVVGIGWKDANDYCAWVGKRLPTEAEWEKVCRGADGNLYPWGNQWDAQRANVDSGKNPRLLYSHAGSPAAWAFAWQLLQVTPDVGKMGLRPVGSYPDGVSPYGVMDLVGNASEWVFDWYNWGDYSQMPARNPVNLEPPWNHCVRGSAWHDPAGNIDQVSVWSLCSTRSSAHSIADPRTGFRCARSVSEAE